MNSKLVLTSLIAIGLVASISLVIGLSQTQTSVAQSPVKGYFEPYQFGKGVYPQVTFQFRDGTVTYDFDLYTQSHNLLGTGNTGTGVSMRGPTPQFTLATIPGHAPELQHAVVQTWEYKGTASGIDYPYKEFNVRVDLVGDDNIVRSYEYSRCGITNYKVHTEYDKAESFTGRDAFAILETYSFECMGFAVKRT